MGILEVEQELKTTYFVMTLWTNLEAAVGDGAVAKHIYIKKEVIFIAD